MKSFACIVTAAILGCTLLSACTSAKYYNYIPESGKNILCIPKEYTPEFEGDSAQLIESYMINGSVCHADFNYYSVAPEERFCLHTPEGLIQEKHYNGQTLAYWQLNDDLYRASDALISQTFSCAYSVTTVRAVYYEFRPVGMLMCMLDEQTGLPVYEEHEMFEEDGSLSEAENLVYLYGSYEFDDAQEAWYSNAEIGSFEVTQEGDEESEDPLAYISTIAVALRVDPLGFGTPYIMETLYEIEGGLGYMLSDYSAARVIRKTGVAYRVALGKNTLLCTFTA